MIDENTLAKWLNKNIQTLRDWRCKGKGPSFVKDSRTVNYRVGTVIDWIKSREVKSTTQADTLSTEIYPSEQPLISYSNWDDDMLIDQKTLSIWLGESESTIEKWRRKSGDGPDPIFKKGKISYRVGTVKEWIKAQTFKSIGEYQANRKSTMTKRLGLKS